MEDIIALVAGILKIPLNEITEHSSMDSNSLWDSLSHLEIIYALEKKFGLEFSGDEMIEITSIKNIKNVLLRKLGENP